MVWNKGKKMPHNKEWEEKRLAAVRFSAKNKVYPKGWKHTEEARKKMSANIKAAIAKDPNKKREQSIKNLPKNNNGEKNGNWRGGIAKVRRNNISLNWNKYDKWKKSVKKRDGNKCKECGSTTRLHVHHIMAVSQYPQLATLIMNGVTLCDRCHHKTESWGCNKKPRREASVGNLRYLIATIPNKYHEYPTLGNYSITEDGIHVIFVSDMGNSTYEYLVGMHEFLEQMLCIKNGVSEKTITDFDVAFEKNRLPNDDSGPGDDPKCPYHKEHVFATAAEKAMCIGLGLNWNAYERFLTEYISKEMK